MENTILRKKFNYRSCWVCGKPNPNGEGYLIWPIFYSCHHIHSNEELRNSKLRLKERANWVKEIEEREAKP